jgi:carbamoyltransferase
VYHLGIAYGHNSTLALVRDGAVVFCQSEERINRIKNALCFPSQTLEHVYRRVAGPDAIASVTVFSKDTRSYLMLKANDFRPARFGAPIDQAELDRWRADPAEADRYYIKNRILEAAMALNAPLQREAAAFVAERTRVPADKIAFLDHHQGHVYSALPFLGRLAETPVLIFTLDGEGDGVCATVNRWADGLLETLAVTPDLCSLGKIYMYITGMLGFTMNEHEYKVMGLAPYAKSEYWRDLRARFDKLMWIDDAGFWQSSFTSLPQLVTALAELTQLQRFDAIAGALQAFTEDLILKWISHWVARTGIGRIACAGGVFMNVKANQRIAELDGVERYVIVPSCADESTAIGCAVAGSLRTEAELPIQPLSQLYLGWSFDDGEVARALAAHPAAAAYEITEPADLNRAVGELLADGAIVARCAGAMEFGARALGNRSILADPRRADTVAFINQAIKNRDFWMPFAPTILDDAFEALAVDPGCTDADFMMVSFDATRRGRTDLIAALHRADFTLRPQRLKRGANPDYQAIIEAFRARTGLGAVLNTSFNLHGEPIVGSPADALSTLDRSGLEHLCLGRYLVRKKAGPVPLAS